MHNNKLVFYQHVGGTKKNKVVHIAREIMSSEKV